MPLAWGTPIWKKAGCELGSACGPSRPAFPEICVGLRAGTWSPAVSPGPEPLLPLTECGLRGRTRVFKSEGCLGGAHLLTWEAQAPLHSL